MKAASIYILKVRKFSIVLIVLFFVLMFGFKMAGLIVYFGC